ncbi:MAG: hypothetical protein FD162_873 [Rhodobacteraceae bacterium]|nr:MAG: hypothetical protein FD162_873 [Paracoccaceae bacterium]
MFILNNMHLSEHAKTMAVYAIVAFVTFLICFFLVRTAQTHVGLTSRTEDLKAVQASHKTPTPRIGGVAIFLGLEMAVGLLPGAQVTLLSQILLASVPVMVAGLLEDMGRQLPPSLRLLAAAISALLAMHLTGTTIQRADVPVLDAMLLFPPFAILFTTFAVAGVCNAINLVDGMNGLAGTLASISAAGLALISAMHGQYDLATIAMLLVSVMIGFLMLNYPRGHIFLGDAGAYLIGFVLAWISVTLMMRVPAISAWSIVLINFWPIADTLLAIYRRRTNGRATDLPDRLHFHQLIKRTLEILFLGRGRWALSNPLTTLVIAPAALVPMLAGLWLAHDAGLAALAVLTSAVLFFGTYMLLLRLARQRQRLGLVGRLKQAERMQGTIEQQA